MAADTPSLRQTERMAVSKLRNLRVDGELWHLASVIARRRATTLSRVMKDALVEYVEEHATEEDRAEAADLARAEAERTANG